MSEIMEGIIKCSACGFPNACAEYLTFLTSRGVSDKWARCRNCKAYFNAVDYEKSDEVGHAETTSYGSETIAKQLNVFKQRMFYSVAGFIKEFAPGSVDLLDIGCSYGGFLFIAKELGLMPEGTDILSSAVEYVKGKDIPAYKCYSVSELAPENKYDVVTALDCNYYWSDQRSELSEIYSRLNDKGLLIIRTASKSWMVTIGLYIAKFSTAFGRKIIKRSVNDHRFSMPLKSLIELLHLIGFRTRRISIWKAFHSYDSGVGVKISFAVGEFLYRIFKIALAPGAILVMEKGKK